MTGPRVARCRDGGELVDLGLELAHLFGLDGDVPVLVGDETREIPADGAQLGAVGGGVARREEGAGERGDHRDDKSPGRGTGPVLGHALPSRLGMSCVSCNYAR